MFGKKKEPKIEFFTDYEELLNYPPQPAAKFYPEWFKKMSPGFEKPASPDFPFGLSGNLPLSNLNSTIKRCPGVISYLTTGYILPLWTDYVVQVRNNSIFAFPSNESSSASLHGRHMHYNRMPELPDYYPDAVKFTNPWKVVTPKGWSVMVLPLYYHFDPRFLLVPGVVDSDVYHHIHGVSFFKKGIVDHTMKMGMPFMQVIPFQRDTLGLEVRHSTEEDQKRIKNLRFRVERFFGKNHAFKNIDKIKENAQED